ncbi:uncharacterized protein THITE_2121779 [Thermothielavioides terrestris NRRL 8126]|uniref:Major facilitator superfamily (MFS) profile domain-containing protein n=1 Tax=Thermothielavioides terrestris (strain ATCC 38088 / NRRL 8126) TaxID=578455 RepID=G2RFA6_THETT|nr:uncharacterized protein THITE_2121779 [Thermothielavioides terrestris NRRL 8126]AEO70389.1 hypothetical protein THITE_2121779 [Thermothielavioides terrestris NRRL 8126]
MSLQRVTSLETFMTYPQGFYGWASWTRVHKLTFNPLPEEWDPEPTIERPQTIAAFNVSRWKRLLQVIASIVCCLLAAGVIFGYGALKPVLKSEGAYRQRCAIPNGLPKDEEICIEMHLNFMFTIAVVATNVAALPVGAILDHYGPRVCGLLGSLLLAFGAVLMAFESRLPIDGLMLGYLLLALGGPFTFMSSFQLSNAFPRHSGLILALLTAAFDASSAVFPIFHFAYRATEGAFTRRTFFLVYLIVPAVIALLQLTLMPARSYKTAGELVGEADDALFDEFASKIYDDEETPLLHAQQRQHCAYLIEGMENVLGAEAYADRVTRETSVNNASGVWGSLHTLSASEQLKSPWFVLICFFTGTYFLRLSPTSFLALAPKPADHGRP